MEPKIKSISEAYSQQPTSIGVCTQETECSQFDMDIKKHEHKPWCIKEITLVGNSYYASNYKGNILHKFLADSVNVSYFE